MRMQKSLALVVSTMVIFSGCSFLKEKEPELVAGDVVQEGLINLTDVKSANYELDVDFFISGDKADLGLENLDFNLNMSGAYDNTDRANPEFSLKLTGNGSLDKGDDESLSGEMRLTNGNAYFTLSDISDFDGQMPKELIAPFLDQWWFIALPPEFIELFQTYAGSSEEDLTEAEKALKELFEKTSLFKDVEFDGSEKIGGVDSYVYDVNLDKSAMTDYIAESAKLSGAPLTSTDLEAMQAVWQTIDFSGKVWIGKDDMTMRQISGKSSIDDLEGVSMDFEMTYTLSGLNEDVAIEFPADANDLGAFFGAAMGGFGGLPGDEVLEFEEFDGDLEVDDLIELDDTLEFDSSLDFDASVVE